jgi:hypothetical protein
MAVTKGVLLPLVIILSGCSEPTRNSQDIDLSNSRELPMYVGGGRGSQFGNYAAKIDGEMIDENGGHCVIFNWDRPLTKDLAICLRSASCPSLERPGQMVCMELDRKVIPISESQSLMEDLASTN